MQFTPRTEPFLSKSYKACFVDDIIPGETPESLHLIATSLKWINDRQAAMRRAQTIGADVPKVDFSMLPAITKRVLQLLENAREEHGLRDAKREKAMTDNNRACEAWDIQRKMTAPEVV